MKRLLVAVLLAVLLVPVARAEPLPGFRESVRLSPRASVIVGQPVRIYCTSDRELWDSLILGFGGLPGSRGFSYFERAEAYLAPWICRTLEGWLRGKPTPLMGLADGLATLVHESIHLRGIYDEAAAECGAERETTKWARALFGVKRTATLRQVVAYVRADAAC